MNKEIQALLEDDYLSILKEIEQRDPEGFRKSVLPAPEKENSLFMSFLKKSDKLSSVEGLLSLCQKHGYSLKNKTKKIDVNMRRFIDNPKQELIPDLLYAIQKGFSDQTAVFLLKQVEPEYLHELEKEGWPLFKMAARKDYVATARYLVEVGCDINLTDKENEDPLNYIERNKEITEIYWSVVNKNENNKVGVMPDNEFFHFSKLFKKKSSSIYNKKDTETEKVFKFVEEKKDQLQEYQKNIILRQSLECKDKRLFKDILRSFGMKIKDENTRHLLLSNLKEAGQMEYLYMFLDKKSLTKNLEDKELDKILAELSDSPLESPKNIDANKVILNRPCGLKSISDMLSNESVSLSISRSSRSKTDKFNLATMTRLKENLKEEGYDFLFSEVDGFNKNVFEIITAPRHQSFHLQNISEIVNITTNPNSIFTFKTISDNDWTNFINNKMKLSEQQEEEIKSLLSKTWLKKDEFGHLYMSKFSVNQFTRRPVILAHHKILMEMTTVPEKVAILEWGFKNIEYIEHSKSFEDLKKNRNDEMSLLFRGVYEEFKQDKSFNWNQLDIDMDKLQNINSSELFFELKALLMYSELSNKTKNIESTLSPIKKMKL